MADDDGPVDGGSIDDGNGPDPFDGVTFDETWVQAARRSEDDAETRVAKLQRIDADYRRLGSEKQTLVGAADKATRRARNRKRLTVGLVVLVLAGLGTVAFLQRRNDGRTVAAPRTSTTTTTSASTTTTTLAATPSTMAPELLVNGRLPDGHIPLFQCLQGHTPTTTGYEVMAVSCDGPFQFRQTWAMSDDVRDLSDERSRDGICIAHGFLDMGLIDSFDQVPSTDELNQMLDALVTAGLAIDGYYAPPADGRNGSLMCVIGFKDSRSTTTAELEAAVDAARAQLGLPPVGEPTDSTPTTAPPLNDA